MTDSFVTQCPHCQTSFRINRAQLGAAHGAVRCGACMRVFNAAQQLLVNQNLAGKTAPAQSKSTTPAPAATAPATPVEKKTPDDTLWIHDDLDLDSLDLDEELAKLEEQELQLSREFLALDPDTAETHLAHSTSEDHYDESWAESLLSDEADSKPATAAINPTSPQPLIGDEAEGDEPEITAEHSDPIIGDLNQEDSDSTDSSALSQPDAAPKIGSQATSAASNLRDDGLLSLSDDPLHLDWQQPKKPWGRWLGWGLLNLLAAAALGGQYLTYHFDELARKDQYRPWFETLCPIVNCTLPSRVDISQIRSTNLVVRSHPQYMDALMVDAILYNRASFAQPFPLLELRFADINGQLIASSRFRPSEYLSGELAGQHEMPPQTPIHISLEIKDPGDKAVNYSLDFHSPE